MKRSKRITLLLLLLLLLIIICTWCHTDKIVKKRALIALETPLEATVMKKEEEPVLTPELADKLTITPAVNTTIPSIAKVADTLVIEENLTTSEPIFYSIRKENNQVTFEGTLSSEKQEALLTSAINSDGLIKAININPKLLSNDKDFSFTLELLKFFNSNYREGFISYQNREFTIGGVVDNEELKSKISQLLQTHSDNINNYTTVKLSAEASKVKEDALLFKEREEREKKELEKKKAIDEALKLEKEQELLNKEKEALDQVIQVKELHQKEAKTLENDIKLILDSENIRFESGQSVFTEKSKKTIQQIADLLDEHKNVQIEISGHTDSSGNAKRNLQLSQNRVNAVKKSLMEYHIEATRLKAIGYGSTKPLVSNDTKKNRQINRRVEFKIIGE